MYNTNNTIIGQVITDSFTEEAHVFDGQDWILLDNDKNNGTDFIWLKNYKDMYLKIRDSSHNKIWIKNKIQMLKWVEENNCEYISELNTIRFTNEMLVTAFILTFEEIT